MLRAWLLILALLGLGGAIGFHVKEVLDHDELLVCRMLVDRLNGPAQE